LDPGHGAHDPVAAASKITKKSITLKVGKLVEAKLKKQVKK
jgi:N-acetylmuramoyl-L-alanine amidase